nr:hypothetical protein [Herbaspirillum rubrisubalbicans]
MLALLVTLHHRQLLRHVEGQVVLDGAAVTTAPLLIPRNWGIIRLQREVLIQHEAVLDDAILDPRREVLAHLQELMQVAGIDGLHEGVVDMGMLYMQAGLTQRTRLSLIRKATHEALAAGD